MIGLPVYTDMYFLLNPIRLPSEVIRDPPPILIEAAAAATAAAVTGLH